MQTVRPYRFSCSSVRTCKWNVWHFSISQTNLSFTFKSVNQLLRICFGWEWRLSACVCIKWIVWENAAEKWNEMWLHATEPNQTNERKTKTALAAFRISFLTEKDTWPQIQWFTVSRCSHKPLWRHNDQCCVPICSWIMLLQFFPVIWCSPLTVT